MQYILDIMWDMVAAEQYALPRLVGPFDLRQEAEDWATQSITNGTWEIRSLAYPYMRRPA